MRFREEFNLHCGGLGVRASPDRRRFSSRLVERTCVGKRWEFCLRDTIFLPKASAFEMVSARDDLCGAGVRMRLLVGMGEARSNCLSLSRMRKIVRNGLSSGGVVARCGKAPAGV
jgi:hypothetical protein